jgi:phosphopantetheine adenylyltransferase
MIGDDKQFTISMNICDTCIWRSAYQAKWISLSTTDSDTITKTKDQLSEISVKISNLNDIISDIDKRTEKAYTAFVSGKGRITPELYEKTLKGLENERTETLSKVHKYEQREAELFNLLNELQTKEKRDIEIRSVAGITDDIQRIEIIKEVVRNMTVEHRNKRFLIEVDTILPVSDRYLYAPKGGFKKLYYINGEFDPFDVDIDKALDQQLLLDITNEIMIRFKLK